MSLLQRSVLTPATALLALLVGVRDRTMRTVGDVRDRGASALEFAIIAAVVVVAASVIGAVVYNIVDSKSSQLEECANQPVGSPACS